MSTVIPPTDLLRDVDRGFRQWLIREIYVPGGTGRYVPNVDDLVLDYTNGWLRVIGVDYTTGISTRIPWVQPSAGGVDDSDQLLGSGPGYLTESFRMFLNTAVKPFTLTADSQLHFYGSKVSYVKVFRGTDISAGGQVVSAFYDQSGEFLGENIPVETITVANPLAKTVKVPKVGATAYELPDGEVVTVVAYTDEGGVASIARLLIMNSSFVRRTSDSMLYVRSIALESNFLSPSDPNTLLVPINMPVPNINLMGVVTYSNGRQLRMPVDGVKFIMDGLNEFVATVEGQRHPLMLHYQLSADEYSYIANPSIEDRITEPFFAVTTAFNGSAGVKLYGIPVWQSPLTGYRMEWFLYNLIRAQWYNVTNLVQPATGTAVFDGLALGVSQRIGVGVNLKQVDPRFADWRHVQNVTVQLKARGDDVNQENWAVLYSPDQNPASGVGCKAAARLINVNNWEVDITCGESTLDAWLKKVYWAQQPLKDDRSEETAPVPNYLVITTASGEVEIPIAQWNQKIVMDSGQVPAQGAPLYVHFLRRQTNTDLQLAVAGLITHRS